MQKFLVNTSGFTKEAATQINAVTLFVFMCLQPLAGALSDRVGRKPLMIAFGVAGVLFTYPIFSALEQTRDAFTAGLLVMAALIIVTGYTSINAVVKAEMFPAHIRALGVALPYALANTIFGGTAEYVALSFKSAGWEQGLLLVRHRDDRHLAHRLPADARHPPRQPDRRGLNPTRRGPVSPAGNRSMTMTTVPDSPGSTKRDVLPNLGGGARDVPAGRQVCRGAVAAATRMEPVVFLPGLLCDQSLWRRQVDTLADRCAPFVADLTLDNSIEAMARRTLAAAPPRFSLAALSMGGYVALEIMRQAPERVRRLALIDTSARADTPERIARRRAGIESLRRGTFLGISRPLLRTLVHPSHWDDDVATDMRAMAQWVGKAAFLRQQRAIMDRPDARRDLQRIAVPTMVAVGEDDAITPVDHAREIHDGIRGSTLHVLPACGHMAALEEPDRISLLLQRWLDDDTATMVPDWPAGRTPSQNPLRSPSVTIR